ncbi:Hypothetical protein BQ3484_55 [Cedratvirus A11]|uniref:Uncharacterized protein n=1 Tax=Cedratvirus A11 TaxID=1903266 RepID=A0A1M7XTW6_9VIRU|nr:Hypothetical protein BQ3484_55 [Cedratvirus A11]SHO33123.1 Hypothetical protein BQ3484_55 [Cedratvirus A11]
MKKASTLGKGLLQRTLYHKIKSLPGSEYFYDTVREEKYGREPLAYDGQGCCEQICSHLVPYFTSPDCELSMVRNILNHDFFITRDSFGQVYSYPRGYGHAYIKASFEGIDLYIDPTYKQLFISKRGPMSKFFSPYSEFLYSLPPVFAGTEEDFTDLVKELEERKRHDPYHKDDKSLPLSLLEFKESGELY